MLNQVTRVRVRVRVSSYVCDQVTWVRVRLSSCVYDVGFELSLIRCVRIVVDIHQPYGHTYTRYSWV